MPGGHLRARLVQHPAAHLLDLAGLLEDRDELVRFDRTHRRVVPAQQCFHADQVEVIEVVDRLIGEPELVALDRRPQIELEPDAVTYLGLHLRIEDLVTILASRLGLVERHVGIAQQFATSRSITDGDADARVDRQWHCRLVEVERLAHDVEQPFSDELR